MGEVYRARDSRLGREVALKILPPAVSQDPDRVARFAREAQVLAALNHPNIAAIYGLEEAAADDGTTARALILELVEGETLAERIARGPLLVGDALRSRRTAWRRARRRAQEGCRSPRSEAGQHQSHSGGRGQGSRLRPREDLRQPVQADRLADDDDARHPRGCRDGHAGVHEPRAGSRAPGGSADRHLGVRLRALRDAHWAAGVRRSDDVGRDRPDPRAGTGLGRVAAWDSAARSRAAEAVSGQGPRRATG